MDRMNGYSDFVSVSEGDLDNLYDADGNYHDEVVVAWTEPESSDACSAFGSDNAVPHLGILNYNGKDASNPTITAIRVPLSDYLNTSCDLGRYNDRIIGLDGDPWPGVLQPNDNIVATAIGDFDGDGKNEIALAFMRTYNAITVLIYRYVNDGTTASLTQVNSLDLSIPNSSIVATLSLAAGNFEGSGVDQLLVGTAGWSGTVYTAGDTQFYRRGTFNTQPVIFLLTAGQTQGTITAAASSGQNNSTTDFTVSLGSGLYVPRTVTIGGATGTWAAINGTWPVAPTNTGFTLDFDTSAFGSFAGQNVTVTVAAPLKQADFMALDAFPSLPGYSPGAIHVDDTDANGRIRVQLVPGLFHYDPNHGFDYRRRQVAMAWNARPAPSQNALAAEDGDPHLGILQITNGDKITLAYVGNGLLTGFQTFQTLSVAAGAFRGDNDTNDPTWSLFLSGVGQEYPIAMGVVHGVFKVTPDSADPTKLQVSNVCYGKASGDNASGGYYGFVPPICQIWGAEATMVSPTGAYPFAANNYLRLPTIAADFNGNSLKLGAPVHFEITNPGKADFILEQPPQHSAWLDLGGGNGPQVVTINRYPSFNTSMQDSQKTDYASKGQNHLDWTVGGSLQATASQTASVGLGDEDMGLEANSKVTTQVQAKVSYDYDQVSTDYTSGYDSVTVGQNATTGLDDYLILESQILDLWRYRVYGQGTDTADPNNPNAFYDIVIPGLSVQSKPGGLDVDWYQPVHEVGNILSYPGRVGACGADDQSPADIGPISIPNLGISNQALPLIKCSQQFYNGNGSSTFLQLDHQTGNGSTADYTHKLQADVDFSYTSKTTLAVFGTGTTTKLGVDLDIHGGADWGKLSTEHNSTTNATGITLNSPQGDSNHAYPYYPIFYNTTAGGLKVAYGVGALTASDSGSLFWTQYYASAPDPALNLPNRFDATYGPLGNVNGWAPENSILRKRMKGFVVRRPAIDPVTGAYPLLGSNPQDGDKVLLQARVYNYSISSTPASFTAQFSVIPYESDINSEVCPNIPVGNGRVCPASARTVIGIGTTQPTGGTSTFSLNSRENTYAYLLWNTQGFGPQTAGFNEYRVYVDLASNAPELYPPEKPCSAVPCEDGSGNETIVDPGQNNEGWSLISVAKRVEGGPLGGRREASPTHGVLGTGDVTADAVQVAATATETAERHRHRRPKLLVAYLHQPLRLRLTAFSSEISNLHGHVSIFDGKPGARRTATIAIKTLHGVTPEGTSSWFTWIPRKTGLHHLYAVIQTTHSTTPLGDVLVKVRRAPGDLNEDGRVDRHDLNMLQRDLNKAVAESACGEECDLDGNGRITQKDADLMAQLCESRDCGFAQTEYVGGGPSPAEPDMRSIRRADDAETATFFAAHPEDKEAVNNADRATTTGLYNVELQRKQSLRNIHYWYKGKPVTAGPYAQPPTAIAKR
jgi:hypothetical protein